MPSLNVKPYINRCIDSVINQTIFDRIEVLLIDAGSTDGTIEELIEYEKKHVNIRLIRSAIKSYGYQVNLGIREAKGEYVGVVETDDYVRKDMFEILLEKAVENDLDYVKADYSRLGSFRNGSEQLNVIHMLPLEDKRYNLVLDPTYEDDIYMSDFFLWKGIYKKAFITDNDIYFEESPGAAFQDIGFTVKTISFADRVMYLKDDLYRYRTDRPGSSMNSGKALVYSKYEFDNLLSKQDKYPYVRGFYLYLLVSFVGNVRYLIRNDSIFSEDIIPSFEWILNTLEDAIKGNIIFENDFPNNIFSDYKMLRDDPHFLIESLMEEDKRHESFVSSVRNLKQTKVIIFGAGSYGKNCHMCLDSHGIDVSCFADNDYMNKDKIGGLNVVPPDKTIFQDSIVIVANKYRFRELESQAIRLGVDPGNILIWS